MRGGGSKKSFEKKNTSIALRTIITTNMQSIRMVKLQITILGGVT